MRAPEEGAPRWCRCLARQIPCRNPCYRQLFSVFSWAARNRMNIIPTTCSSASCHRGEACMLVLGYAGHRRHGWKNRPEQKLASRLRHAARHPTIFDSITSHGEDVEDLPVNLFPLDGVGHDSAT